MLKCNLNAADLSVSNIRKNPIIDLIISFLSCTDKVFILCVVGQITFPSLALSNDFQQIMQVKLVSGFLIFCGDSSQHSISIC